jgi:hypothetical protein
MHVDLAWRTTKGTAMKRNFALASVAIMLLGSAVIPAHAQDDSDWGWHMWGWGRGPGMMMGEGPGFMGRMAVIDGNGDGVISDDEAAAQVAAVFAAMDADDDGQLTEEEYMAVRMGPQWGWNESRQKAMQERKKARFAEMDADKNGTVSQAEFFAAGKARFAAADADKDGKVTPWEFRAQRWQ